MAASRSAAGPDDVRWIPDAWIAWDASGVITAVAPWAGQAVDLHVPGGVATAGFVDGHVHAAQTRIVGAASGPLLDWLATTFVEDGWSRIQVGRVRFRQAKPVDRCVITTVDPFSLERGREPLRALARHRRSERGVLFAVHLIPETTGAVRCGDEVTVLE